MNKAEKIYKEALKLATRKRANIKHIHYLLEEAISLGNYNAMYALGTWYLHGKSVEKDYKKGFLLIQSSLAGNIKEAFYDLAVCYEIGKGIRANKGKAFEYYLKAALLGDKQSIYEIGRCYYYGKGIKKDHKIASIWLEVADILGISLN